MCSGQYYVLIARGLGSIILFSKKFSKTNTFLPPSTLLALHVFPLTKAPDMQAYLMHTRRHLARCLFYIFLFMFRMQCRMAGKMQAAAALEKKAGDFEQILPQAAAYSMVT
jgi:hypothetical protein